MRTPLAAVNGALFAAERGVDLVQAIASASRLRRSRGRGRHPGGSETAWRRRFWLTRDYLPKIAHLLVGRPPLTERARAIGARIEPVLIPWDCVDGFYEAYWRRPEAYLDDTVRKGISIWSALGPTVESRAVKQLREDLASGRWAARNKALVNVEDADLGLRLLIA